MKKTLAIVLALVMVLCMIPAMSAEATTTKTITDKNYTLNVNSVGTPAAETKPGHADKANSVTFNYHFENEDADGTGKWTEATKMAIVSVGGFDDAFAKDISVTIDGKKLGTDVAGAGWDDTLKAVAFPVELTKAGYSDTYLVQVTGKDSKGDITITETAKITVKLVNTAAYKDAKTATITNIASDKKTVDAYIVGSKIYLDYVKKAAGTTIDLTFADENGKAFTAITYANEPSDLTAIALSSYSIAADKCQKLDKSAATYYVNGQEAKGVKFGLETAAALYETKKYDIVVRENIVEADPKGIYFAEPTKTIAMGESYAPVVMGVATNKRVDADIAAGKNADANVIDVKDSKTVIGTKEGVAYITATYKTNAGVEYKATGSMKIIVTEGPIIPPAAPTTTTYYVTCRNLNVRKGAGTSYAKAGMVHRGDALQVVEIANNWAKLANGTYVCAKYIAK